MNFLMHHKRDFGINAKWHCNATGHGKCLRDRAGPCLKSAATHNSLQAHLNDAIFNSVPSSIGQRQNSETYSFLLYQ